MYREPRGWFPPRPGRFAFGVLCLLLGAVMLLANSARRELSCVRDSAQDGRTGTCSFRQTGALGYERHFPLGAISEVRAQTRTGKGNQVTAHAVVLLDRRGSEWSLSWSDAGQAGYGLERATNFFAQGSQIASLELAERPSLWSTLLPLAFVLGGIAVAIDAFRGSGSFRIETEAADPTTDPPRSLRERWTAISKTTRGTIVFFGAVFALAGVAQIVVHQHASVTGGFLEVNCVQRCRFAGAECLPGSAFGMGLDVGPHTLEVYDADSRTKWRPLVVNVERGVTTQVDCK